MSYTKKYTFAPLPQTNRGEAVKLSADPKGKTFLYTNGKSVFIRDIENPALATEYAEHTARVTVARYSPSGFYIASGDINGNIRIWDTVNEEHILKSTIQPISGRISDLAWDSESKRIIAVGEGKERFGHAFMFDSLSSTGEITGHSKVVNHVSIRQQRPFRAVTCADDMSVVFYHGVPFKYQKTIRDHTRFVNAVEFSPNGDYFVSVGADGKIFLYDGKTGDKIDEFTEGGHTGSIFSVAWSPDSTQFLTSAADCTAKIWDVSSKSVVQTFTMNSAPNAVDNQQVGNLWQGDHLLSVSLSGEINYLDKNSGTISRSIDGHTKAITALAVSSDDTLFTGSYDGRVYAWNYGSAGDKTMAVHMEGDGHSNQVTSIAIKNNTLISAGMDDTVRQGATTDKKYNGKIVTTGSLPRSLATSADNSITVVATGDNMQVYDADMKKIGQEDTASSVVDVQSNGKRVFTSDGQNNIRVLDNDNGKLTLNKEIVHGAGNVTVLASHPELNILAVGDNGGRIYLYDVESGETVNQKWVFHSGRITALDWSTCGCFLVSSSVDTNIYVWNKDKPFKKVAIKNAHVDVVNSVRFLHKTEQLTIASVGQDAAVRIWEIQKPE
ncbi:WD40-repeat-containing domain protein [Radiomyces spectabilis]|uniref:WD40-repeat-containing domain protein n=1 Tax=Radiomyces spectabilis TaxID=64574 RepID=UPI00221E4E36|nr:WD40-repeat-containing domain protein [Radiomyces spectabilis]KAI8394283.1 WD40-repeat-containing domain protein [Radiomyces spectabilis]